MKSKIWFKVGSNVSLVLFYFMIVLGIASVIGHYVGEFEPIFGQFDLVFNEYPALYADQSFINLSLLTVIAVFAFSILFTWYMHKLLKNIYKESLFMQQNVTILFKLGITFLVLGCSFNYMDGLLAVRALDTLEIANASLVYANLSYIDPLIGGILLLIIASALKVAVRAVEENNQTI
ncbi:hypothetical protein [Paenibacillus donghaensis]|uniref:DUF2975 domain-containing protein n=1 Tax=Paenibacillus donghaensis TaxID=414771 RepID=A0A2Z2K5M0_9BACL|nr:hypothetical protein [Paenibacillus donghaensis]ASA21436.1 hypothetical protein B9T62_11990 [Paenibacillus donghaensis]